MVAGTGLEREISARFDRSCAAVFFVTSNLLDEAYLATEVGYAIREKRVKGDNFAISVCTLPCEVFTYPDTTNPRLDDTETVP